MTCVLVVYLVALFVIAATVIISVVYDAIISEMYDFKIYELQLKGHSYSCAINQVRGDGKCWCGVGEEE